MRLQAETRSKLVSSLPLWQGIVLLYLLWQLILRPIFLTSFCHRGSGDDVCSTDWNFLCLLLSHARVCNFGCSTEIVYMLAQNDFADIIRTTKRDYFGPLPHILPSVCYFLSFQCNPCLNVPEAFAGPPFPAVFVKRGG